MKRVLFCAWLVSAFCIPSFGQIHYLDEAGEVSESFKPGVADIGYFLFSYRVVYDRYPNDKQDLVAFLLDEDSDDGYHAIRKSLARLIKSRRTILSVSGDTCSFFFPLKRTKEKPVVYTRNGDTLGVEETIRAIQCIGGPAEMQKIDPDSFQFWIGSFAFDINGKCLKSLCQDSPFMPREISRRFRFVVTMEERHHPGDSEMVDGRKTMQKRTPPVLIPITMTRSGAYNYDFSCLDGIQLSFQEYGKPLDSTSTIGSISIKEAFDSDYFNAIKAQMKVFMDEHEEVDSMKLWELVLFNNPPDLTAKQ